MGLLHVTPGPGVLIYYSYPPLVLPQVTNIGSATGINFSVSGSTDVDVAIDVRGVMETVPPGSGVVCAALSQRYWLDQACTPVSTDERTLNLSADGVDGALRVVVYTSVFESCIVCVPRAGVAMVDSITYSLASSSTPPPPPEPSPTPPPSPTPTATSS